MVILLSTDEAVKYSEMTRDQRRQLSRKMLDLCDDFGVNGCAFQAENRDDSHLLETEPSLR